MNHFPRSVFVGLSWVLALGAARADTLVDYRPSPAELAESYRRADRLAGEYQTKAFKLRLEPNWLEGGSRFWYRNDLADSRKEFLLVDTSDGSKAPAFDHRRLADALSAATGTKHDPDRLPFRTIEFSEDLRSLRFDIGNQGWRMDRATYALTKVPAKVEPRRPAPGPWRQDLHPPDRRPKESPDKRWTARIEGFNVAVKPKDGEEFVLSQAGAEKSYFARLVWTPDSKRLIGIRVLPGDRKQVHLLESSPAGGGEAILSSRVYDRPGDKVDTFDLWILDPAARTETPISGEKIEYGGIPDLRWRKDGRRFTFEKMDRGYGRWRIVQVDSSDGSTQTIVDDDPLTFVDSTNQFVHYVAPTEEVLWRSERDGWGHLYLTDGD
ncbi:MAG TPA: DPP IV N-terminal domain-containing protein, partial [Fimbriimonas sp.]